MADYDEKLRANDHSKSTSQEIPERRKSLVVGRGSPGVARIEAISKHITSLDRVFIFGSVFLIAYVYGLDGQTRFTYQATATNSYATHSLLATVNVARAVIAAAAQPTAARIADVFGRVELMIFSAMFYTLGTIVEACANGVSTFAAGAVIYQIGYTCILLIVEVVIADITSLRARLFFSYIPTLPFIINTWISGNITSAVLLHSTWKWGIGMWAIIYPVCILPLIFSLWNVSRKAKGSGTLASYKTPYQLLGSKELSLNLFWQLDIPGIILLIAVFGLIFTPLTLAGGFATEWVTAHIVAPLVVGFCTIPVWIYWEARIAKHPLVPFHLLKDRAVWGALGIATFLNFAWTLQGDYLYTVLVVAFDFSILSATRVSSLYSFASVITGFVLGAVVYKVRQLKWFILTGTCLFMVAFGLLINYRGSQQASGSARSGVIGAQILLGLAGGLFPYPAQASIQAATLHEHVAVITGLYLACYSIGSALGNTVSGAIWSQVLPAQLAKDLTYPGQTNKTLALAVYSSPLTVAPTYLIGSLERTAIIASYQHIQRLLCTTGICLCVPLIAFAACLRNPKLGDEQSRPDAEGGRGLTKEEMAPGVEIQK